jgi:SAM-dependent methyltransferase
MAELTNIREAVRKRYAQAAIATAAARGGHEGSRAVETDARCCGADAINCSPADHTGVFGADLYDQSSRDEAPDTAINASLGCGVPTAVADLRTGETVLDLGSGAGADVLISARRVAPTGRAIGLDMTDEMLDLARANAREAGVTNVEFVKGYLEDMPLPDASVDVVISNCVINLSGDKPKTIAEAARVLRPGGRFAISDVIADPGMSDETKADIAAWTGCIAGALTESEFREILTAAGFDGIEIRPTHQVHEHASSAIIRAHRSATAACCGASAQATCCEPDAKADCCNDAHASGACGCQAGTSAASA